MNSQTKYCPACATTHLVTEFHRSAARKDGLASSCKACKSVRNGQWYAANAERHAENRRKWYAANPEKVVAYTAKVTARSIKRAHRYNRAFKYFEGRQGWTDLLAASAFREKRLHEMEWMVSSLSDRLAEYV